MGTLQRIQDAILEQNYRISSHANEEMSDDDLESEDIESIILSGMISRQFTHDQRGPRYEVLGKTVDKRWAYVVCRFIPSGTLLIITAYLDED